MNDKHVEDMIQQAFVVDPPDELREKTLDKVMQCKSVRSGFLQPAFAVFCIFIILTTGILDARRSARFTVGVYPSRYNTTIVRERYREIQNILVKNQAGAQYPRGEDQIR